MMNGLATVASTAAVAPARASGCSEWKEDRQEKTSRRNSPIPANATVRLVRFPRREIKRRVWVKREGGIGKGSGWNEKILSPEGV